MEPTLIGFGHLARRAGRILFALTMVAAGPAFAGDLARPQVIGFSADGRYVAFEEYGAQDGSGFPYASIYVIDVAANDWVAGSPIRVRLDYDALPDLETIDNGITQARDAAMAEAEAILTAHGIVPGQTGSTLIYHPLSDLAAPAHDVSFSIGAAYSPYYRDENLLSVAERTVEDAECDRYELGPVSVMTLSLTLGADGEPTVLQDDDGLPDSRGCTTGYRIHSVFVYAPNQPDQSSCCHRDLAMLVLLGMSQFGFEGPDWRFLGVTTMLSDAW